MMRRGWKKTGNSRGLTLIELIIAMTATAVIILTAFSLIVLGLRVYEKNRASMDDLNGMRLVLLRISQDVRSYEGTGTTGLTAGGSSGLVLAVASSGSYYFQDQSVIRKEAGHPDQKLATGIQSFSASIVQESGGKFLDVTITGVNDGNQLKSRFAIR